MERSTHYHKSGVNVNEENSHFLNVLTSHSPRQHTCFTLVLSKNPVSRQDIGPRKEPIIIFCYVDKL